MHILFLTDNFPPECNAPATRTYEHTREWVKQGHKVTIITCAPNFPEGKVFLGYKNSWIKKEKCEDVNVWRVKTYIAANEGFIKRILDFVSFMLSSFFFGLFSKKVDVVIGTSPQFFTVISAWALAKLKRVPFVFELRDIWPASITAVGAMKKSKAITILEALEVFLYKQADLIISVTYSFKQELVERGINENKIEVILNGVDLSKYKPRDKKSPELVKQYDLEGKFVAGYIGTHGLAHALDTIVNAAVLLEKINDNIIIIFVGGGADRLRIEQLVKVHNLQNTVMIPRRPKEKMPELWSLCDVSLVNLKNNPLFQSVIPSKIFESMGMGIPVIMSVPDGESTKIVRDTGSGVVIPPENPVALANVINDFYKGKMSDYNKKDIRLSAALFDRKKMANDMLMYILKIV